MRSMLRVFKSAVIAVATCSLAVGLVAVAGAGDPAVASAKQKQLVLPSPHSIGLPGKWKKTAPDACSLYNVTKCLSGAWQRGQGSNGKFGRYFAKAFRLPSSGDARTLYNHERTAEPDFYVYQVRLRGIRVTVQLAGLTSDPLINFARIIAWNGSRVSTVALQTYRSDPVGVSTDKLIQTAAWMTLPSSGQVPLGHPTS